MIRNYLKLALRNFRKFRIPLLINVVGTGTALACCLTAYVLIAFNLEFDDFHKDEAVKNIFRAHTHFRKDNGRPAERIQSPVNLGPALSQDFPGVSDYCRFYPDKVVVKVNNRSFDQRIAYADSSFFEMFNFPLVVGDQQLFKQRESIFIDEKTSLKYFGDDAPIGQTIDLKIGAKTVKTVVAGVIKNLPLNNTFVFNVVVRFEHFLEQRGITTATWTANQEPALFMKLQSTETAESINDLMEPYVKKVQDLNEASNVTSFRLVPFKSDYDQDTIISPIVNTKVNLESLIIFAALSFVILLIACANFTNTSIVIISKRFKETGLQKTLGATKWQVATQFLIETWLLGSLSLLFGLVISKWLVPAFTGMFNFPWNLQSISALNLAIASIAILLIFTLITGIYPLLFTWKQNPIYLLKQSASIAGTNWVTRALIILQFSLSTLALVGGISFVQNAKYIRELDFGYHKDQLIAVRISDEQQYQLFKNRVSGIPEVLSVAATDTHIGQRSVSTEVLYEDRLYQAKTLNVGENYLVTMGLELTKGRTFSEFNSTDIAKSIVVNEALVSELQIREPLSTLLKVDGSWMRIVGVVKNHIGNIMKDDKEESFIFKLAEPNTYRRMIVKTSSGHLGSMLLYLEEIWREMFPETPYRGRAQNDIAISNADVINNAMEKVFLFITLLGTLLSTAGIFSLASLNVEKSRKQIAIRRVLGASLQQIISILNREFVLMLFTAVSLGLVLGYLLVNFLLNTVYPDHLNVEIVNLLMAGVALFLIGLFTSHTTIKSATRTDPLESIRNE